MASSSSEAALIFAPPTSSCIGGEVGERVKRKSFTKFNYVRIQKTKSKC